MSITRVLVTCATGAQGRGVVQHCFAAGLQVSAYVLDPTIPAATQLAQWGSALVRGDLDDLETLRTATHGMNAVFEVQTGDCAVELQRSSNRGAEGSSQLVEQARPQTRVRVIAAVATSDGFIRHWTIVSLGQLLQNLLPPVNALCSSDLSETGSCGWTRATWGLWSQQQLRSARKFGQVQVQYRSEDEEDELIWLGDSVAAAQRLANQGPGGDAVGNCQRDFGAQAEVLTSLDAFLEAHVSRI
ncbi:uncharacterized protein BO97DRAFT_423163 [Aspergillus homomorphus CBS 101889]|uniref:NmrA-like domain-containing protein n=1 Tax=Aspergillus homomorphus (strain CBS 101889) TaxID=1450537 RepID=A0A395I229_ASPHC|nr:hypothetical protein BO97DRAFT_423163 [Aspergillus homomorphus CBS 101889]RAL13785.1 hypothetical protein BO97DRAFT_423163 [Aspergillus homomorphus CBS 101889]